MAHFSTSLIFVLCFDPQKRGVVLQFERLKSQLLLAKKSTFSGFIRIKSNNKAKILMSRQLLEKIVMIYEFIFFLEALKTSLDPYRFSCLRGKNCS